MKTVQRYLTLSTNRVIEESAILEKNIMREHIPKKVRMVDFHIVLCNLARHVSNMPYQFATDFGSDSEKH